MSFMANSKYNKRSVSLPSQSHSTTTQLEEKLKTLEKWELSSASTSASLINGISALEKLHVLLVGVLALKSVQGSLSKELKGKCLDKTLEESIILIDVCETTRVMMCRFKEKLRALESSIRRRNGDSGFDKDVKDYVCFRRQMRSEVKKMVKRMDLKTVESPFESGDTTLMGVVREVNGISLLVLKSLLSFLSVGQKKWAFCKLVQKKLRATNVNEVQRVDMAIEKQSVNYEEAKKALNDLEITMEKVENLFESLTRRLIICRASILNIVSL